MVTLSWLNLDSYQLMIRDGGKKMVKYEELVDFIIKNIGGKENVISLTHCVTRLRFQLKDEAKANDEALKVMMELLQFMHTAGQYKLL